MILIKKKKTSKQNKITNTDKDAEKMEPLYIIGMTTKCCTAMENGMVMSPNLKIMIQKFLLLTIYSKK